MKKILLTIMCISILLLTSCSMTKEKTMKCSRTVNQENIKMTMNYTVKYKGKYVTNIKSVEKITTDDLDVLNTYKEQIETTTKTLSKIKYYDHNIQIKNNTLTSTINVNYQKIDTKKLIETEKAMEQIIDNGKVEVNDIESLYNQLGIICES